jgi:hypothetical protein
MDGAEGTCSDCFIGSGATVPACAGAGAGSSTTVTVRIRPDFLNR